ncbi:MAG: glycosyltransferase [Ramlibacter sp.]
MTGFWVSAIVFALALHALVRLHFGLKTVQQLSAIADGVGADAPRVSVIVSALNEAVTIEPALRSLLALDYPHLELIAINDRSTDNTGAIMDRLAQGQPRLRVIHISELPAGWLGKNHALHVGAEAATGDYLLFTDADVLFEPRALRRAITHCEQARLDHLVVMAELTVREHLLAALLLNLFSLMFAATPPWRVRSSSTAYMGMGAFNMVRAAAYRQAGGHAALRLEVVDDIMLGKRMKQNGFRQDVLMGLNTVTLEWYKNTAEFARGVEKNSFAMVGYSVARMVAGTALLGLMRYWPIAGLFVTHGASWWLNLGAVVALLMMQVKILRLTAWSRRCLWWWPASAAIMLYINWRGVILTLLRRGINWRGTFYPLAELRRARREKG